MAQYTAQDFKKGQPRWCPGCGDHFFLGAFHKALAEIGVEPHNTAVISGGSLVYGNANNCTFISNHVAGDGGAISGCDLIYKCKFINNTVDGSGGAIFSSSAAVDCTFIGNNAQLTGGAIRFTSGREAKVVNCYFEFYIATLNSTYVEISLTR